MFDPRQDRRPKRDHRRTSLYLAVPGILVAAPIIGFLIGHFADGKLGTEPYLTALGVVFGFASAGMEVARIIKKVTAMDKEESDDSEPGT